jgi:potassium-transporting ATPase potassium-binding subunit
VTVAGVLQLLIFLGILLAATKPLGRYMARLFAGERVVLSPVLRPVELGVYRITGVNERQEMRWTMYAVALLLFNLAGALMLYLLQRTQGWLPFNPENLPNVEQRSAFNTAVSFMTNTNWQGYGGESTMSYLIQMAGLTVQNFVSAATGIAIAIALIRGFARRSAGQIGNFWVDLVRATLYVLLPISIVGALVMVAAGVPQNLDAYVEAAGLTGAGQTIAMGRSSRCWAPTAAGSSTPTPPTRSRTRPR